MVEYSKVSVILTDTQLKKLKTAVKDKTVTTLRMSLKMFNGNGLPHDSIKQYNEVRKISTWQGDDYTTGCLLDFAYFKSNYRLIPADLSKQKVLDADSRAIQQIIFTGKTSQAAIIYYIYEVKRNNTTIF